MTTQSDPQTIFELIRAQAQNQPQAEALRFHGRESLSYAGLIAAIEQVKSEINSYGLGRNDRIAVVHPNGPEMALIVLGILACASCAPLNQKYTATEFEFYLADLNVKAVIVRAGLKSPVIAVCERLNIPVIELAANTTEPIGTLNFKRPETANAVTSEYAQAQDTALILHTSGTTSRPKIVPLSQQNLLCSAQNIAATLNLTARDSCFNIMPLFHIHGMMAGLLSPLVSGGSVICSPGFAEDPFFIAQFFPWLIALKPTWYTAVPTMHQAIIANAPRYPEIATQCPLRFIRSSSSSLAPQIMATLESIFHAPVIEAYGMTEAAHQMASNPLPPAEHKPKSVGLAAGPEVAIMDTDGKPLPIGSAGEIVIRGPNVMRAYENNEQANATAFYGEWFRTGDEGVMDAENYLYLTGRLKELINRGGEKLSPREIDEVLMDHPAILQAVTFAAPHPSLGEVPAAAIILREGFEADAKAIQKFAAERLAAFKIPNPIIFVTEIPKGPTGKLQRIGLAEKLLHT